MTISRANITLASLGFRPSLTSRCSAAISASASCASSEPLYQPNEAVELRRKNGIIDKGVFTGFSGSGTGRVALVATPTGEIGVPLAALDNPSRRRLDPEYREAFIQHLLSTKLPEAPGEPTAGQMDNGL